MSLREQIGFEKNVGGYLAAMAAGAALKRPLQIAGRLVGTSMRRGRQFAELKSIAGELKAQGKLRESDAIYRAVEKYARTGDASAINALNLQYPSLFRGRPMDINMPNLADDRARIMGR